MSVLNLKQILAANDLKTEIVDVPEWGGQVVVRGLTGLERDAFDAWSAEKKKAGGKALHVRAKLVAMSLCEDESGKPAEVYEADIVALSNKSGAALDRLADVCLRLSGFTKEDAEKNLSGPSDGSGAA